MQILTTRPELEAAVGSSSVGYVSLSQKNTAQSLHPGHEYLVNYSKANYDLTVVSFWETMELMYEIYGNSFFLNEVGLPWDSTGCLAWCETMGVDYVLLPEIGYSKTYMDSVGIDTTDTTLYTTIDQIWADNNYPAYEPTPDDASMFSSTIRAKVFVMLQNYKTPFNNHFIASWKDGYPRFTMAHYVNNYTTEHFELLDPVKTPDDLYYSSSYFVFTEAQKDIIKQFETVVDTVGYSDTTALTIALNDLDTGVGFEVRRIDLTLGGVVGAANDFINIQFRMGSYPDAYPIYKKGVR